MFGSRDKETSSSPKTTEAIRPGSLERKPEQSKLAGAKDKDQSDRIRVEARGKPQIKPSSDGDRDKKAKDQSTRTSRLEAGSGSESEAKTVSAGAPRSPNPRSPNTKDKVEGKGETLTTAAVRTGKSDNFPKGKDARRIELDRDKKGISSPQMRTAQGAKPAGAFHRRSGNVELTQRSADLSRAAEIRTGSLAVVSPAGVQGTLPVSIDSGLEASLLSDTGGVTITGDNNVYIAGDATGQYPHPYGSQRSHTNLSHLGSHHDWNDHGSYFSLKWSHSSSGRVVSFHRGSHYGVSYYHPWYHRKYIFVSIGGYWPFSYRYRRYYRYGCHPHRWYGANVITYPASDTYNTYNYYYDTPEPATYYPPAYDTSGYDDFSDVRERLARERLEELYRLEQDVQDAPYIETEADIRFNEGVEAFAEGDYLQAVDEFREAIILSPDDIVLPFTYSQALFAAGEYAHAASVLRAAIERMPEGEETVYYPRGLYADEEPLTDQIAILAETATNEPFAGDFDLLLGYQLLGSDRFDEAGAALDSALADPANEKAAGLLLKLLEEARAEDSEAI